MTLSESHTDTTEDMITASQDAPPLTRSDSSDDSSSSNRSDDDHESEDEDEMVMVKETEKASASTTIHSEDAVDLKVQIDDSRQFQEDLKYCKKEEENVPEKDINKQPCVHFDDTVSGVEISSHRDYPESMRERIWSTLDEINSNASRNMEEFMADDWDWQRATEEEDMVLEKGRLVHPASCTPSAKKIGGKRKQRSERKRSIRRRRRRAGNRAVGSMPSMDPS